MTLIPFSKNSDDIPPLPKEHYGYGHLRFPTGDNIPCYIHDAYVDYRGDAGVKLIIVIRYGPYEKKEKVGDKELTHVIKPKFLYIEYSTDESYALSKLFNHYKLTPPEVRYPDFSPENSDEEKSFLGYFERVFKDFFIPRQYVVYVDTDVEIITTKGIRRTYTELLSKLKIVE